MAQQQINLYTPDLVQRQRFSGFGPLLLVVGAILGVSTLVGGVLQWRTATLRTETAELTRQVDATRQRMQAVAGNPADTRLSDQVLRLREQEASLRRVQVLLDNGSAGRREGYSDVLEALARQAHPVVWITGLTLQGADDAIELQGRMTEPAMLTDYLRKLQAEPRFKGRQFGALSIRQPDPTQVAADGSLIRAGYSEFTLRSHSQGATGMAAAPVSASALAASAITASTGTTSLAGNTVPGLPGVRP